MKLLEPQSLETSTYTQAEMLICLEPLSLAEMFGEFFVFCENDKKEISNQKKETHVRI